MTADGIAYAGIDIGGTKLVAVIGDSAGSVLSSTTFPTSGRPESDLGACLEWIDGQAGAADVRSIGVACPGPYDRRDRVMLEVPNMPGWQGFELGRWFDGHASRPTRIMNDANAGACAEWIWGGHGEASTLVFLTMSTGMGGGVVVDGKVLEGSRGFAAEIGRVRLADEGPVGFGERGTAEGFLSGSGLAQAAAAERLVCEQRGEASGLRDHDRPDARVLCDLAAGGDAAAMRVIERTNRRLGQLIAILGNVLEPDVVVLGTIAAAHPGLFLEPARAFARGGMIPGVHDRMRVVASGLRDRAARQALAVAVLAAESSAGE